MIKKLFNLSYDEERKIELKLNRIINLSKERALQKVGDRKPVIFDNYHTAPLQSSLKLWLYGIYLKRTAKWKKQKTTV